MAQWFCDNVKCVCSCVTFITPEADDGVHTWRVLCDVQVEINCIQFGGTLQNVVVFPAIASSCNLIQQEMRIKPYKKYDIFG